ncbi:MAG: DJ-1/PfpI family protein [Spirochaetales bacterium]|nr:DJ-1/PfpI family protein [Spirochaetales bacterium]
MKKNCYLYVLETMADWEIAYLTAELNSGRFLNGSTKLTLHVTGAEREPVRTMGGWLIEPTVRFDEIDFNRGDLLILPGADSWQEEKHRGLMEQIPSLLDQGVTVAAVCGATVALGQHGILNNREHTSNSEEFLAMMYPAYTGQSHYREQPAVTGGGLITASGLKPLEFTREVLNAAGVMKEDTLQAWYDLYRTGSADQFQRLMETLKSAPDPSLP